MKRRKSTVDPLKTAKNVAFQNCCSRDVVKQSCYAQTVIQLLFPLESLKLSYLKVPKFVFYEPVIFSFAFWSSYRTVKKQKCKISLPEKPKFYSNNSILPFYLKCRSLEIKAMIWLAFVAAPFTDFDQTDWYRNQSDFAISLANSVCYATNQVAISNLDDSANQIFRILFPKFKNFLK